MTICDGDCRKLHAQLSDFFDDGHLTYLCTPCWQKANYFRSIAPKTAPTGERAA